MAYIPIAKRKTTDTQVKPIAVGSYIPVDQRQETGPIQTKAPIELPKIPPIKTPEIGMSKYTPVAERTEIGMSKFTPNKPLVVAQEKFTGLPTLSKIKDTFNKGIEEQAGKTIALKPKPIVIDDNSLEGIILNTIKGLPKAGLKVAKEIGQGVARTVGTVGITAANIPQQITDRIARTESELPFEQEIPTEGSKITKAIFGGKPIKTIQKQTADVKEFLKPYIGETGSDLTSLPLVIGSIVLDLSGMGGKAGVTSWVKGEIPETFFKWAAKETDEQVITNTLKSIGLDDARNGFLTPLIKKAKTVDEVKQVLENFEKVDDTAKLVAGNIAETQKTTDVVPKDLPPLPKIGPVASKQPVETPKVTGTTISYPNKTPETGVKIYGEIKPSGVAKIDSIEISKSKQNSGLGTKYIKDFENWAKNNGSTKIEIDAYKGSTEFWEKMGYTLDKEFPIINGIKQDYKYGYKNIESTEQVGKANEMVSPELQPLIEEAKKLQIKGEFGQMQEVIDPSGKKVADILFGKTKDPSEVNIREIKTFGSKDIVGGKEVNNHFGTKVLAKIFSDPKVEKISGDAIEQSVGFWGKMGANFDQDLTRGSGSTFTISRDNFYNKVKGEEKPSIKTSEPYKESGELTTKLLQKLEGKTTVSKQFISDLTNSPDLKQVEKDTIRQALETEGDKVDVTKFAEKVKAELLPLKVNASDIYKAGKIGVGRDSMVEEGNFTPKYEGISLPKDIRGKVANYKENIYESPIPTSAGDVHFGYQTKNYFDHTRVEDMADDTTRRIIEVQSDLYQKGNLEKEISTESSVSGEKIPDEKMKEIYPKRYAQMQEAKKLQQYNDPTAHFRMVREEIKKAAQDGKTKLQFPTGETAMKIEGLGDVNNWFSNIKNKTGTYDKLTPQDLKIGLTVRQDFNEWVITDLVGDGKFKAVPKESITPAKKFQEIDQDEMIQTAIDEGYQESFDISSKIDANNPIYKFYEKDLGKYLTNNYGAKPVIDSKGVKWYEVDITDDMGKKPVTAFNRPIFTQDPQILRQEALDMIAKEIPKAKVFFYEPGELGLGVEGQHTISEFFGDIIKLVERDGKVGLITAKHEVKHALFSKLDGQVQKEALEIAKKEIGPLYKTILEKRYGEKGKYVGVNRENALLEEYIVDKWAKADANAEGKYTKSVFGKIFEALDKLLKKIVDTYNEIKPKWDKFFKDRGGSQGGYVDFFGEKGKGISETERLVAQGKVRIKEKDGKKIFQYNNKGDWFTAINEKHAVDQFKKEKVNLPPKKEVKADTEDSQINKLTEKIINDKNVISDEEFDYMQTMRDEIKQYKSESVLGDLADRIVNGGLKIRTGKSYKTEARELLGGHYMRLFTTNPEAESLDEIVQTAINQGEDVTVDDLIDTINNKIAIRKAQIELNKQAKEKARKEKEKLLQRIEERKQSLKSAYQKTYMQTLKENKITEAKTLEQESDILDQIYKKQDVEIPIDSLTNIVDKIQTPVNKKVGLHDYFRTPEKVLNKIGLGEEAKELRESYENYQSELPEHIKIFKDWKKEVDNQPRYKLDKFQTYLPPEVKIFKYLDGNLDELKTPLSPTEYKVAIEIKEYLKDWAYRLGLPEDDQIKHYITHLFENEIVEQEFDEDLAKIIRDKIPGEVYDPFLQERIGAKGFKQDVWASLDAYAKRGVRKVNMDPILAKIKDISSRMEDSQQQYIKKHLDTINMRPTDIETLIDNTLKQIFGYKFGQRPFTTLSRSGRQMIYRAMLGGNIGSALKNLTQGVNTYAEIGEKYTLKGYSKLLTNMGSGEELEKAGILKNDMIQDRVDSVRESLLQKGDKVLFYLFETAEKINRGAAYFGAKQKALDEGKSEYEAVEYAKSIVRKTQFNFGSIDTPVALGSDLMKTLLQFSTFPIKQMEFLSGKMKAKDWAGLLRYIGATIAIVLGVGKLFNIKWKDFNPFTKFANLFDAPPLLNVPTEILKAVMDEPGYFGQKRDAGEKVSDVFQTGVSNIVPGGVQIMKSYRGLKKGNQPIKGVLLGPSNIEKKKKTTGVLPKLPSLPKLPKLPKI